MNIRPGLWPFVDESGREWLPPSSYTLEKTEKERLVLKKVKVPNGYAAYISRCVHLKPIKIFGLKSHESHILMQQLLPISLRKLLPKSVRSPLIRLCRYFRDLCSKALRPADLDRMEKEIAVTLCQLEKIFPPSFFDITVHLTIHLVTEAKLAGPVHSRWMYPIERKKPLEIKKIEQKKLMHHVTGKKSFAQVEEELKDEAEKEAQNEDATYSNSIDIIESSRVDLFARCYTRKGSTSIPIIANSLQMMEELKSKLAPGSKDVGPEDIFSQVNGQDKWGKARMHGFGVNATDVYDESSSQGACYRRSKAYQVELDRMMQRANEQDKQIQEQSRQIQEQNK